MLLAKIFQNFDQCNSLVQFILFETLDVALQNSIINMKLRRNMTNLEHWHLIILIRTKLSVADEYRK
jgi:hypothetical protein